MTSTSLLSVSVGPVQDFISAARRSRDLWSGSRLLAELSLAAAKHLQEAGATLIFPVPAALEVPQGKGVQKGNVSNVLLASMHGSVAEATALAEGAAGAARRRLHDLMLETQQDLRRALGDASADRVWTESAQAQLNDLLEVYWAAVPVHDSYQEARQRVQSLLAGRKFSRTFAPVTWGSSVQKSSLDGQREAVTLPLDSPAQTARIGLRPGEHLCAPGLLKRVLTFGKTRPEFLSTAHVAAQPYLQAVGALDQVNVRSAYRDYTANLESLGVPMNGVELGELDPQLLYPGRLTDLLDSGSVTPELEAALVRATEQFLRSVGAGKPSPYYAILHADGDNTGALLSHLPGQDDHLAVSAALQGFSDACQTTVEAHHGTLIYAGGDDVLALVPAAEAVACSVALAQAFRQALSAFSFERNGHAVRPTLTSGVVIAHMLDPFQDALDDAREAERFAKVQGRALTPGQTGFSLHKRSGAPTRIPLSNAFVETHVQALTTLMAEHRMPRTLGYALRAMLRELHGAGSSDVMAREVKRILDQKSDDGDAIDTQAQEVLLSAFHALASESTDKQLRAGEFGDLLVLTAAIQGMDAPGRRTSPGVPL